ncbi:MAG: glycoside hydrolase family 13 protein [Candidatus Nanopelagicales bacterium]
MTVPDDPQWYRSAVVYQVYLRSFADGDGDGVGDIAGLRSRLPYLADLGVDAIWINPWYPSPMADAGYDVIDQRAIDPVFGTLEAAEALIEEAHGHGLRVILDVVPNHTSEQRPWFLEAVAGGPGCAARSRYHFRDGTGEDGDLPPNNWVSEFGGSAWTRVTEPDGTPGQWYLHLFSPQQPDLNWDHPQVRADFEQTLRFWFDRGVDGFRIDVAHYLVKGRDLPDLQEGGHASGEHPHWDREALHDIYRRWRQIADSYDPPRTFVAEVWVASAERLVRYVREDELHTAFNFDFLASPWLPSAQRDVIEETLTSHESVGAAATWVLSNHDVARHVSRYARPQVPGIARFLDDYLDRPVNLALGIRRARAALLQMLALPGSAYVYLGEELGLPEVEDLPEDALLDPMFERSGRISRGRDGCRVPLPWSGDSPPYGFSPPGVRTWLPQPPGWAGYTVAAQQGDPASMLEFYRTALRLRRAHPALGDGPMRWLDTPDGVLGFAREPGFECLVNYSQVPYALPPEAEVLLASADFVAADGLPPDTAVWLAG